MNLRTKIKDLLNQQDCNAPGVTADLILNALAPHLLSAQRYDMLCRMCSDETLNDVIEKASREVEQRLGADFCTANPAVAMSAMLDDLIKQFPEQ